MFELLFTQDINIKLGYMDMLARILDDNYREDAPTSRSGNNVRKLMAQPEPDMDKWNCVFFYALYSERDFRAYFLPNITGRLDSVPPRVPSDKFVHFINRKLGDLCKFHLEK